MSQRCSTVGPVTFEQVMEVVCDKKLGSLYFNGYGQVYFDKDQLMALINEFAVVSQSHVGALEECARLRRNIDEMELERNQRTVPVLPDDDFAALVQCEQTMIDDNSYDLDAATMQRLADYGAVWHKGGGYYAITKFGNYLLKTKNGSITAAPQAPTDDKRLREGLEQAAKICESLITKTCGHDEVRLQNDAFKIAAYEIRQAIASMAGEPK